MLNNTSHPSEKYDEAVHQDIRPSEPSCLRCFELAVNSSRAFPRLLGCSCWISLFHWCVVESKSSGEFTCRHSRMFQEGDPAAEWDSLPVLSADVKPKMTLVDFDQTANRHPYLARLTDNKFLLCFRNGIGGQGMQCQAVEEVVGGVLTDSTFPAARNMAPKSRRTRWLFAAMQVRF